MPIYHIAVTPKKEGPIWIGKEKRYSRSEISLIFPFGGSILYNGGTHSKSNDLDKDFCCGCTAEHKLLLNRWGH